MSKIAKTKVALSQFFFFTIIAILSPSTIVGTILPVAHHNAKSS
jgi:hypothetical protein